jgi:hypothetical protein
MVSRILTFGLYTGFPPPLKFRGGFVYGIPNNRGKLIERQI